MEYLPGADFLLDSRLDISMHSSSNVVNTVFVLNCIRSRSWLMMRITLLTKMQKTSIFRTVCVFAYLFLHHL